MPFTPYHFGPSGFIGLVFKKYIDIPVFVLANVIVDVEVLFYSRWPVHRYAHTLLIGSAVGIIWGMMAYPLRNLFAKIMRMVRLPYRSSFWKMVFSGVLGVWLHVLIDAVYHWDVWIFWPSKAKPLYGLISQGQVKIICIAFFIAAIIVYVFALVSYMKQDNVKKSQS